MYQKTQQKPLLFADLKERLVITKAFRNYSSKSGGLNPPSVARSIILHLFAVLVPFCNTVRMSIPSRPPAYLSYPLISLDF